MNTLTLPPLRGVGDCDSAGLECPECGRDWLNPLPARPGEYECSVPGCRWSGELPERDYLVEVSFSYRVDDSADVHLRARTPKEAEDLARRRVLKEQGGRHQNVEIDSARVELEEDA